MKFKYFNKLQNRYDQTAIQKGLYNNFEYCSIIEHAINIVYTTSHEKLVFA